MDGQAIDEEETELARYLAVEHRVQLTKAEAYGSCTA
jgi:hypothetical protein